MANPLIKITSLVRLGLIHPDLLRLVLHVKTSEKSYLSYTKLASLVENYLQVYRRNNYQPHVAEFGVGRGGSAMILAWMVNRYGGTLTLFDVFGRIPPPTEADGDQARQRYQAIIDQESQSYYGNITDLMEVIKQEVSNIYPVEKIRFVKGRYEDTLPGLSLERALDLVHIDCDWYQSAQIVFAFLEKNLQTGAILQVDDYYFWQGAQRATDEARWLNPYFRKATQNALIIDTSRLRQS